MNINKQIEKIQFEDGCHGCVIRLEDHPKVISQIKQSILKAIKKTMVGHNFDKEWLVKLDDLLTDKEVKELEEKR